MKIQVNHIMWWEVKDCCTNQCKSNNFKFLSMLRLLIVLDFVIFYLLVRYVYLVLIEKYPSVTDSGNVCQLFVCSALTLSKKVTL